MACTSVVLVSLVYSRYDFVFVVCVWGGVIVCVCGGYNLVCQDGPFGLLWSFAISSVSFVIFPWIVYLEINFVNLESWC